MLDCPDQRDARRFCWQPHRGFATSIGMRSKPGLVAIALIAAGTFAPGVAVAQVASQREAADSAATDWQITHSLVGQLRRKREYANARQEISRFLMHYPKDAAAYDALAWLCLEQCDAADRASFPDRTVRLAKSVDPVLGALIADVQEMSVGRSRVAFHLRARRYKPPPELAEASDAAREAHNLDPEQFPRQIVEAFIAAFVGDFPAALRLIDEIPGKVAATPRATLVRAIALSGSSPFDQSLQLAKSVMHDPDCGLLARDVAISCLGSMKRHAEALPIIEGALAIVPDDAEFLAMRSAVRGPGEASQALRELSRAIESERENPVNWVNRAYDHIRRNNDRDAALADLNEAIALKPDSMIPSLFRSGILLERHQYEEALADLNDAIRINPYINHSFRRRARALENLGQPEQSRRDLARARWLERLYRLVFVTVVRPNEPRPWQAVARYTREAEEWDFTEIAVNEALKIDPEFAGAFYERAAMQLARGNLDEALTAAQQACSLEDQAIHQKLRGDVHFAREEWNEAIADYEATSTIGEQAILAYEARARIHREAGRIAESDGDLERAKSLRRLRE